MESFRRREEKRVKEELSQKFFLAQATAEHIGMYLNKENKARNLTGLFSVALRSREAGMGRRDGKRGTGKSEGKTKDLYCRV